MMKGQRVPAVVRDWKWTESQGGTPGLRIFCEVTDPNGLEEPKNLDGTIWFSEKAMKMAKRQLRNLGIDADKVNLATLGADFNIIGNALEVQLDEYQGNLKIGLFGVMGSVPKPEAIAAISESLKKIKDDEAEEEPAGKIPKHGTAKRDGIPF